MSARVLRWVAEHVQLRRTFTRAVSLTEQLAACKNAFILVVVVTVLGGSVFTSCTFAAVSPLQKAQLDQIFGDLTATTPGCVAGVTQNGRLVYAQGFGMADLGEHIPMSPDTVLEIGSLSKQFTAASILMLAHNGKLSINDPVRKYLTKFPAYGAPVTIRELLHHTSGVRDVISLMETSGIKVADAATQQDAVAMIDRQQHLNFVPDTEYEYSNSGYVLLAEIVRQVTGESLTEFEANHIFVPLDMNRTFVATREEPLAQYRARSYAKLPSGGYVLDESHWVQIGDGGVNTTVGDYALWMEHLNNPFAGDSWLIRHLETRGRLVGGSRISYAGGMVVDYYRNLRRISHNGAWQGYRTSFELFPSRHLGVVALCNGADTRPDSRVREMADVFLRNRGLPSTESSIYSRPSQPLAQFLGLYVSADRRQLWRVQIRDGRTVMGPVGNETSGWLEGNSSKSFTNDGMTVVINQTSGRTSLELKPANTILSRCASLSAADVASQLHGLSFGNYYSIALQVTWHLVEQGRTSYLEADGANPNRIDTDKQYLIHPLAANVFSAGPYFVVFSKGQFWLFVDRASGIHFVRTGEHSVSALESRKYGESSKLVH